MVKYYLGKRVQTISVDGNGRTHRGGMLCRNALNTSAFVIHSMPRKYLAFLVYPLCCVHLAHHCSRDAKFRLCWLCSTESVGSIIQNSARMLGQAPYSGIHHVCVQQLLCSVVMSHLLAVAVTKCLCIPQEM